MEQGKIERAHSRVKAYLVEWLARRVWYGMMWLMRRPRLKHLRLNFTKSLPPFLRDRAWQSYRRQERFARRYGLVLSRILTWLILGILTFQVIGALILTLQAQGGLSVPE